VWGVWGVWGVWEVWGVWGVFFDLLNKKDGEHLNFAKIEKLFIPLIYCFTINN